MNLIPWKNKQQERGKDGGSPLATLRAEMDRLFDAYVRGPFGDLDWPFGSPRGWVPAVDVAENEKEIAVRAEVPGIAAEDIEVTVSGNHLILAGEKTESTEESGKDFFQSESRYGSFRRAIPLPQTVDPKKVDAEYSNGVLTIHLKKTATAPARRVEVKVKE